MEEWLRAIGLDMYIEAFRQNDIDAKVLPALTVDDLKDLGIASVGHRRKMLTAISALVADPEGEAVATAVVPPKTHVTAPRIHASVGERRQLTVLFCDLVGSTALARQLDPEDMSGVLRQFQTVVAQSVAAFSGYVAKLMGDGALVYFGYPQAHEDDPERAVRAGLALNDAVREIVSGHPVELNARVGIATGIVVVGEVIGRGDARERGVVGETPNLAARLQALAAPGTVVVGNTTQRLLKGAFALHDLGHHALKGIDGPVQAWSVGGDAGHASRFEAAGSTTTPFVGRDQELALLGERWRDAVSGEGQVLLLSGEAGIGKSRILRTFTEHIATERHATLLLQCSPHRTNDAFFPLIGQIRRMARLVAGEPASASVAKLEAFVERAALDPAGVVPSLASLLAVQGGHLPAADLPPREAKERLVTTLLALFLPRAEDPPVLVLVEDAHWIDPSSLEFFDRFIASLVSRRVLMIVTFRPEFASNWARYPYVTSHGLNHFGRRHVLAMIAGVKGGRTLPSDVLEEIVEKTDGVPLFVEELTKSVIEAGTSGRAAGDFARAVHGSASAIPATLHDSLMARLDRLGRVKEIAQFGAAIGREFPFRLLEAIAPIRGDELLKALQALEVAGLLHGSGQAPDATYVFKHALIQSAAYSSLLRAQRQGIHAEIVAALNDDAVAHDVAPTLLAYHASEAGLPEQAIQAWLEAGEAALAQAANSEAVRYFETALALLPQVTNTHESQIMALALHIAHVNALMFANGIGASETRASLQAASRLLDLGIGTNEQRLFVIYALSLVEYIEARMGPALDFARHHLDLATQQSDPVYQLVGHLQVGTVSLLRGELLEALAHLEAAETFQLPTPQASLSYGFIWEPSLAIACLKRWTLLSLGRLAEAERLGQALETQPANRHLPYSVAFRLYLGIVLPASMLGDLEKCEIEAAHLVAYCEANKVDEFAHQGRLRHACTRALRDPSAIAIASLPSALGSHWSSSHVSDSYNLSQHAEVLLLAGDIDGATAVLETAFDFVERSQERHWLGDLHCLAGRIELARLTPNRQRARACFDTGISVARSQNSRMAELRAATALAELCQDASGGDDPKRGLVAALAAIDGGRKTRDVQRARHVLAKLGSPIK